MTPEKTPKQGTDAERQPEAAEALSLPFAPVAGEMERPAVKIQAKIQHVLVTYPSQEAKEHFEALLHDLLSRHLNALGIEIGMVVRAALADNPQVGIGAALTQTQMMLESASAGFQALIQQIDGPKVEIATVGDLPPSQEG